MAKRMSIEERIEALAALRGAEPSDETLAAIEKGLASKTGLVVAAAAQAAAESELAPRDWDRLEPAMIAAFARLSENGVKRDPGCRGKLAIAEAFHARGVFEDDIFATGISTVQREPSWGPPVDTAAELRARSGLAYAELFHPEAINALATLLADPERAARIGATVALGNSGRAEAIGLLRFKAEIGDDEPEVFASALRALLTIDPDGSLSFVGRFLDRDLARAEAAAVSLGESRQAEAFPLLRAWAVDHLEVGYLAIALLRIDEANDFLVGEIEHGEDDAHAAAIKALEAFAHDTELAERVRAAKNRR